ncbi:hypothetical protein MUP77_18355, partial [Candidatus Bathyarchaeota archaeon]|nr:hypothetical protein [Candidatus Bathyarchaeota archaeon]
TERADMDKNATLRGLLRSRLFLLPTLTYVRSGIYLVMLVLLLRGFTTTPFQAALYTSTASISASIPIFLLRYRIAKRSLPFKRPTRNIVSYVLATILMMSVISQIHLAATLSRTLALIGVGAVVYFCIIVVIDSEARTLVQSVVGFARKKLRDIQ